MASSSPSFSHQTANPCILRQSAAAGGATAMLQGMTAHYLACSIYPLQAGDTCLLDAIRESRERD